MYERGGRALPRRLYSQVAGTFEPRAQDHARTVELWIPYPPEAGRYLMRFTLLDEKRQPFDIKNVPFAVTRVP